MVLGLGKVMDPGSVALWRDMGLIFLMAEGFIVILPAIFLLIYGLRGLRRAKGGLLLALTSARMRTRQVEEGVSTLSSFLVSLIIRTLSGGAFVLEVLKAFLGR